MIQAAIKAMLLIGALSLNFGCQQQVEPKSSDNKAKVTEVAEAKVAKVVTNQPQDTEPKAAFPFDVELKDVNGKIHSSAEVFKKNGKPTVLFFWLTTCAPCHMKLNAIKPLYPEWQKQADFNAFAISGDFTKNFPKFVSQTNRKNWEWETYNDHNRAFREILPGRLNGYPQTFIFDKDGQLVYQDKKYRPGDEHKLFEKIKEICQG